MALPFSTEPDRAPRIQNRVFLAAAAVVVALVAVIAVATLHREPVNGRLEQPTDSYASQLPITGIALSEATNGAGGKVTYVEGTIQNSGSLTLTGANLQVTFNAADGTPVQRQVVPLTLIRTRQPYVDLQSVAAQPVKPGESREFRLIFESVPANWSTDQPLGIRVVHTKLR